jgi:hypothetical protein
MHDIARYNWGLSNEIDTICLREYKDSFPIVLLPKLLNTFTVVPIEVFLKYWFNTLPRADQFIWSSSSRYSYTSCERANSKYLIIFGHFLSIYDWLVAQTNKGDWCIQTIQQEVYNYTRKCMNISRNLIKWIGKPEVMYWINIWGTLQLERQ